MTPPKTPGRPRSAETAWRPPCVKCDKWGYYYDNRATKEYARWKHLKPDAAPSQVWAAYEALSKSAIFNTNSLLDKYFASPQFIGTRPQTQKDYQQYAVKLRAVFGEMDPDEITSAHVQLFMDSRGAQHPVAANHERSLLSMMLNWGKARDYITISNPCDAVKPIANKRKNRDYSDADHAALYNYLGSAGHIAHQAALEIAYLCGSRQQDVLRIYDDGSLLRPAENDCYITKEGIVIWQAKTGKVQLKRWTPRLRAAVDLAQRYKAAIKKRQASPWLICTRGGSRYTRSGFNAIWLRAQREAETKGLISKRFRFHDTKHKGITDFEGDKQQFSGHASASMITRYDHSIAATDAINKPLIEPSAE